jgi:hypothetical protein
MGADQAVPWTCPNGHVMGLVRRNSSRVRQLLLYRVALDMQPGAEQVDVDVIAIVEGRVMDVRCSVCESMRTWFEADDRKKPNHGGTEIRRVQEVGYERG